MAATAGGRSACARRTEADLGDGIFPLAAYLAPGRHYGIGSDSNMATDAAGELRLLEQGQRLDASAPGRGREPRRTPHCGAALVGGRAAGRRQGRRPPGGPAGSRASAPISWCSIPSIPSLSGRSGDLLLDSHLFAPGSAVRDVMVGGGWSLRDGHHAAEAGIARAYRRGAGPTAGLARRALAAPAVDGRGAPARCSSSPAAGPASTLSDPSRVADAVVGGGQQALQPIQPRPQPRQHRRRARRRSGHHRPDLPAPRPRRTIG